MAYVAALLQGRTHGSAPMGMVKAVSYSDLSAAISSDRGSTDIDKKNVSVFSFWRDSDLHSRGWSDPNVFTKEFSEWMFSNVPIENAVHWVRVVKVCLHGEKYDDKGKAEISERLLRQLGMIMSIPEHLIEDSLERHASKMDVFGSKGVFLSLRVQGLAKQKIDYDMLLLMTYWKSEKKANTFGMYEEQVTLFYDPTKNLAISTHQRYFRSSFAKVQDKLKNIKSQIRNSCESSYMVYAFVDCVVDAAFPILEMFADMIKFLEDQLNTKRVDDEIIQASGMAVSRIMDCLKRVRMNQWRIREILVEQLQDEWGAYTEPTKDLFKSVLEHTENNVQIIDRQLQACDDINHLRGLKMIGHMDYIAKLLTGISLIVGPMQWWTGLFSLNFANVPFYVWEYSYLIFWIIEILIGIAMSVWFFTAAKSDTTRVGTVENRINARLEKNAKAKERTISKIRTVSDMTPRPGRPKQLQVALPLPSSSSSLGGDSRKSTPRPQIFFEAANPSYQTLEIFPQQQDDVGITIVDIKNYDAKNLDNNTNNNPQKKENPQNGSKLLADLAFYNVQSGALEMTELSPQALGVVHPHPTFTSNYNVLDDHQHYLGEAASPGAYSSPIKQGLDVSAYTGFIDPQSPDVHVLINQTLENIHLLKRTEDERLQDKSADPKSLASKVMLMKKRRKAERTLKELQERRDRDSDVSSLASSSFIDSASTNSRVGRVHDLNDGSRSGAAPSVTSSNWMG